jgi:hypothetical protein
VAPGDSTIRPNLTDERRRTPRFEILGQVLGNVAPLNTPVRVRDIGLGGFGIESAFPLPVGAVRSFLFTLADRSTVTVDAKVIDCRAWSPGGIERFVTDLEFVDNPAEDGSTSANLIDKITSDLSFDVK